MSQEPDDTSNLSEMAFLNWSLPAVAQEFGVPMETIESLMSVVPEVPVAKPSKSRPRPNNAVKREIRSWADYKWICQQCNQTAESLAELREHTQLVHSIYFGAKCNNCPKVLTSHRDFVTHVTKHMWYLRNYCQYCNKCILNKTAMSEHVKEHLVSTPPCDVCGKFFSNSTKLAEHITTNCVEYKASEPETITCDICFKQFAKVRNLKKHRAIHDPDRKKDFKCPDCDSAFFSKTELKDHAMRHAVPNELCEVCNKKFHTRGDLNRHLQSHSSLRPFECNECGKRFGTKRNIITHLKSHSDDKRFKCKWCPKAFKHRNDKKAHEDGHMGIRKFQCEVCDKSYTARKNCDLHMRVKHGMTLAKTKITPVGKVAIDRSTGELQKESKDWMNKLLKQNCDKSANNEITMGSPDCLPIKIKEERMDDGHVLLSSTEACSSQDMHVSTNVKTEIPLIIGQEMPAATTIRSEPRLDIQNMIGSWKDYKWTCRICDHPFASLSSLCEHTRSTHKEYFAAKCIDCDLSTKSHREFVKHVSCHRTHLRQYCQYCNENIIDKLEMSEHIAEHLALSSPCDTCGQIFRTKSLLSEHIQKECDSRSAIDTEIPTCDICHKTFDLESSLIRHVAQLHNWRKARKHACDKCNKSFFTNKDLVAHKKRHYDKKRKM